MPPLPAARAVTLDAAMRLQTICITAGTLVFRALIFIGIASPNYEAQAMSRTYADEQLPTPINTAAPLRAAPEAAAVNCRTSDIALEQLKSRVGRTHSYIVGRVLNNCDLETGVHIKIVILDHAGGVLRVADFWPASTDNIPAHSGFPFQTVVEGSDSFDRFQVTVVEVKRWTG
jgi:hypothetical protein